jgi:nucleoside-diphosphate-sugar epimerase
MKAVVTGGAGFIGSHLTDALIDRGDEVVVIDDLSNGKAEVVNERAQFVEGDVADADLVRAAIDGAELVFHEAALGSVKRSIETPLRTDHANVHGTLTVLDAARAAGVRRVVAASSSSVYGGAAPLPSSESDATAPRSPYAVTKVTLELYCRVYAELLGLDTVCLRYFNVFGPRQRSDSAYAAVVPLFVRALLDGDPPTIYGDGEQRRDFTYVDDAVRANLLAAEAPAARCSGRVYNVSGGAPRSILELLTTLSRMLGVEANPVHGEPRPGDARDSAADLSAAATDLGYEPTITFEEGLRRVLEATGTPDS